MSAEENKALVRRFVEAVNAGDYGTLDELLAPHFTRHCQATPEVTVRSAEDFKNFDRQSRASFPDQHVVLEKLVAEGDLVALWCRYQGTQKGPMGPFPASGKRVDCDFAGFFRVANGRLAELWVIWDNLAMLAQLGHFPPPK